MDQDLFLLLSFHFLSFHFVAHLQPLEFAVCYRNGYAHICRYKVFAYMLWLCIQLLAAHRGGNAEDVIVHTRVIKGGKHSRAAV